MEFAGPGGPGAGTSSGGPGGIGTGGPAGSGGGTFTPVTGVASSGGPSASSGGGVQIIEPTANPVAAINEAYYVFMTSVSGLDDDFNGGWVSTLGQVSQPAVVKAAEQAAGTLEQARDHGVGTLRDDHRVLHVDPRNGRATLTDCLDEYHWYVVSDRTGQPDPGVARGYFRGSGTFVESAGRWLVQSWKSESTTCRF